MMSPRLQRAPADFLSRAYARGDWLAVLIKSAASGGATQRVRSVEHLARPGFLAWLRAENAARGNVYVSINTVVPGQRTRRRQAIAAVRHLFLDVDSDLARVLAAIRTRSSVPPPSWVIHSSPGRGHVLWRVQGFTASSAEALVDQGISASVCRSCLGLTYASRTRRNYKSKRVDWFGWTHRDRTYFEAHDEAHRRADARATRQEARRPFLAAHLARAAKVPVT
jgi:hypothetical protein